MGLRHPVCVSHVDSEIMSVLQCVAVCCSVFQCVAYRFGEYEYACRFGECISAVKSENWSVCVFVGISHIDSESMSTHINSESSHICGRK